MATGKALNGKPYAGNPHVRFDEGEVAPAATPRRGSLLYKQFLIFGAVFLSLKCLSDTYKIVQTSGGGGGPGILVSWTATRTYKTSFGSASDDVKDGPFTIYRDGDAVASSNDGLRLDDGGPGRE